jgi:enoyl-CoA hydratase/carnithine racemase
MQFKHVTLEFDGPVAILKLDHPEVMNAVSIDMLGGLGEALDEIGDKKAEVRCLVITGAGRAFCTGAGTQQPEAGQEQRRRRAGNRVPSVSAAAAQPALPDRHLGQWPGRRRRDELCVDG